MPSIEAREIDIRMNAPAVADAIERWCSGRPGRLRARFSDFAADDFSSNTFSVVVDALELVATAQDPGLRPAVFLRGLSDRSDPIEVVAELDRVWSDRIAALRPIPRAEYFAVLDERD